MNRGRILLALALGVAATHGARAAQTPVDILIQRLVEKNILSPEDADGIRAEIAQIEKEQAAQPVIPPQKPVPSVAVKYPLRMSGYAQLRYIGSNASGFNDSLEARRVRLTLTSQATPKLDLKTTVDFAGSRRGQTSATSSALFGRPVLLDAVAGVTLNASSRLQIGQFKVPFGSESVTSGSNFELIHRSGVTEALTLGRNNGSSGRDIGLQFNGSTHATGAGGVDYILGIFNGSGINTRDDNNAKDIAARVAWKQPLPGLTLGAEVYDGRQGTSGTTQDRQGVNALFQRAPWFVRAEHIWGKDGSVKKRGYYTTLAYTIVPRSQVAVRYDRLDPNTGVGDDATGTVTLGFTRLLSNDGLQRWQLNYEHRREEGRQVSNDQYLAQFQLGF